MPPQITKIPILPFNMVNTYLIEGQDGCILVDAGLPGSETKVAKALAKRGYAFEDIKLIVITHAHIDHAGSAAALRKLTRAPIVAHAADAPYYRRETPMTFYPTDLFARLFLKAPLVHAPYEGFVPDLLLSGEETFDLSLYGVNGSIRHTPGHTAGSVSVLMESGVVLAGDLIASGILLGGIVRNGHAKQPPFEDNPRQVAKDLQSLLDSGMERFYIGHGGPLPATEVQQHIRFLLTRGR